MKALYVVIALMFAPWVSASGVPVEFASPLVLQGDLEFTAEGRVLLFGDGDFALNLDWPGPVEASYTNRYEVASVNSWDETRVERTAWPVEKWSGRDVQLNASARSGLSVLQIWGETMTISLATSDARASSQHLASCWPNLVEYNMSGTTPWLSDPCQAGEVGWRVGTSLGPAAIMVEGLRGLEVMGTKWTCTSTDCPPMLPLIQAEEDVLPTSLVAARTRTFVSFDGHDGALFLNATGFHVYAATTSASFNLNGVARLPSYHGPGADPDGNQTLRVQGSFGARQLTAEPEGTFAAMVEFPDVAYLDEAPFLGAGQTVAAAASLGLFALLAKIAVGLLSRSKPSALRSPRRRHLLSYIELHPGATFRELVRGTDIPAGTARHHVGVLKQANLIMEKPHNQTLRYFENHGKFEDSWNSVVLLREPELNSLHQWLRRHQGTTQKDILAWAESQGWSRSTAQHRLKRLEHEGLVTMRPMGRWKCYTAHKRAPVPSS